MGKVKVFGQTKGSPDGIVSIPYGKGKDKEVLQMKKKTFVYQSPMGKVKRRFWGLDRSC